MKPIFRFLLALTVALAGPYGFANSGGSNLLCEANLLFSNTNLTVKQREALQTYTKNFPKASVRVYNLKNEDSEGNETIQTIVVLGDKALVWPGRAKQSYKTMKEFNKIASQKKIREHGDSRIADQESDKNQEDLRFILREETIERFNPDDPENPIIEKKVEKITLPDGILEIGVKKVKGFFSSIARTSHFVLNGFHNVLITLAGPMYQPLTKSAEKTYRNWKKEEEGKKVGPNDSDDFIPVSNTPVQVLFLGKKYDAYKKKQIKTKASDPNRNAVKLFHTDIAITKETAAKVGRATRLTSNTAVTLFAMYYLFEQFALANTPSFNSAFVLASLYSISRVIGAQTLNKIQSILESTDVQNNFPGLMEKLIPKSIYAKLFRQFLRDISNEADDGLYMFKSPMMAFNILEAAELANGEPLVVVLNENFLSPTVNELTKQANKDAKSKSEEKLQLIYSNNHSL